MVSNIENLPERLKALFKIPRRDDRAATFVSELLTAVSDYAASRIPEISDDPDAVDRAMRWGFAGNGSVRVSKTLNDEPAAFHHSSRNIASFEKIPERRCEISAMVWHASSFIRR
jgi:hypothetical protein